MARAVTRMGQDSCDCKEDLICKRIDVRSMVMVWYVVKEPKDIIVSIEEKNDDNSLGNCSLLEDVNEAGGRKYSRSAVIVMKKHYSNISNSRSENWKNLRRWAFNQKPQMEEERTGAGVSQLHAAPG